MRGPRARAPSTGGRTGSGWPATWLRARGKYMYGKTKKAVAEKLRERLSDERADWLPMALAMTEAAYVEAKRRRGL